MDNITAYRLRSLRKKFKMSQQQVANAIGITRTAYNKYECGVIKPVQKLHQLAELFGVSADYILGRDGIEPAEENFDINPHDHNQIKKYLVLSDEDKDIVDIMLDALYEREINSRPKQKSNQN